MSTTQEKEAYFVRCRGLPYSATEEQIRNFFEGLNVVEVTFTSSSSGRPSGECYCEFTTAEEAQQALKKDHQDMGSRYVEVFDVGDVEMEQVKRRKEIKHSTSNNGFIRVRGLPYNCKKEDLVTFFQGLSVEDVIFGKEPGIEGRPTGEGVIRFSEATQADRALQLNGQHLGSRYLEIFKIDGGAFEVFKERSQKNIVPLRSIAALSDAQFGYGGGYGAPHPLSGPPSRRGYDGYRGGYDDYDPYYDAGGYGGYMGGNKMGGRARPLRGEGRGGMSNRYSPYGGEGGYGSGPPMRGDYGFRGGYGGGRVNNASPTKVFIRGLPFRVSPKEIEEFFAPLVCVGIQLGVLGDNRASGDGIVEFATPQEAKQALQKDRQTIGSRYVELFPSTGMKIPANTRYDLVGGQGRAPPNMYDDVGMYDDGMQDWNAPAADGGLKAALYGYGAEGAAYGGEGPGYGGGEGPGFGGARPKYGNGSSKMNDYNWPTNY